MPKKTSSNPGNEAAYLDVLKQDIEYLTRQLTNLDIQVARLNRLAKGKMPEPTPQEKALIQAIEVNTDSLDLLISQLGRERRDGSYFQRERVRRVMHTGQTLKYYQGLAALKQQKTDLCPCGEHRGIEFINKEGGRVDHLCPKHWWLMQTWMSKEDGTLVAFLNSTPLKFYLSMYAL